MNKKVIKMISLILIALVILIAIPTLVRADDLQTMYDDSKDTTSTKVTNIGKFAIGTGRQITMIILVIVTIFAVGYFVWTTVMKKDAKAGATASQKLLPALIGIIVFASLTGIFTLGEQVGNGIVDNLTSNEKITTSVKA